MCDWGQAKPLIAPKQAAPSFRWCSWKCRCTRIRGFTTAWQHWAVVVITPHSRLNLGPTQALQQFLEQVAWLNLEELSRRTPLDPLLNLLTLPIRPERDLAASSQQILASRPDLDAVVLPMLMQRFPKLSREEIMVIAGIPHEELRHTRAAQEWFAEGRQEGRQEGEAKVTLRLLSRRSGSGAAAGATGGPRRCPARLPGPGRPDHLARARVAALT